MSFCPMRKKKKKKKKKRKILMRMNLSYSFRLMNMSFRSCCCGCLMSRKSRCSCFRMSMMNCCVREQNTALEMKTILKANMNCCLKKSSGY